MKTLALLLVASTLVACSNNAPTEPAAPTAPDAAEATPSTPAPAPTPGAGMGTPPAAPMPVPSTPTAPSEPTAEQSAYLGRWTGVEGMYLQVTPKPAGGVSMEMQWDLDNKGTFDGSVTAEGLRFTRNDIAETAVPTNGDATGLKYLAGKQDCLTVKPGEGYCRD